MRMPKESVDNMDEVHYVLKRTNKIIFKTIN